MSKFQTVSKFLSLVLRHRPQTIGLTLDENGWADVNDLLKKANVDIATLEFVVATNDKKRFAFNEDKTKIRASQGHSIKVDLKLEPVSPPPFLFHGTQADKIDTIKNSGRLCKMKRRYVHLSQDISTAIGVATRRAKNIAVIIVDSKKMTDNGCLFYLSENGVWLTDSVPSAYFYEIVYSKERE